MVLAYKYRIMLINVMGFPVKVVFTDDLPEGEYGHCKPVEGVVYVATGLTNEHREAVLYHELGHFIWSKAVTGKKVDEEEFCTLVEFFATFSHFGG